MYRVIVLSKESQTHSIAIVKIQVKRSGTRQNFSTDHKLSPARPNEIKGFQYFTEAKDLSFVQTGKYAHCELTKLLPTLYMQAADNKTVPETKTVFVEFIAEQQRRMLWLKRERDKIDSDSL